MLRLRFFVTLLATSLPLCAESPKLQLKPHDHIAFIGNSLAARMSLPGHNHFEALLYQRFPDYDLVVRNLGWPADEVALRPRTDGFGTPDQNLAAVRTDVIIAFFGFNESFKGPAGVEQFKADLDAWITHTQRQNYSGKGAPRIALVGPIPAESISNDSSSWNPAELNPNLELYSNAMKAVCIQRTTLFADVFSKTETWRRVLSRLMGIGEPRLTKNGIHVEAVVEEPNVGGDLSLAEFLDVGILYHKGILIAGMDVSAPSAALLLSTIEDKNFLWQQRYRIVDSYYVYGGRADLKFADGDQTNRDVMQREREVLDQMITNRDQQIWAIAQGKPIPSGISVASVLSKDENTLPYLDVKTFFGTGKKTDAGQNTGMTSKTAEPDAIKFLSPEEEKKTFTLAKGYDTNCFASEREFPDIGNAVAMAFDTRGRLWVSTFQSYPQWRPGEPMNDKVLILKDDDHDGKADREVVFAEGLHMPISFQFHDGGILVSHQRELLFLKDTNGDDKADVREQVLDGFDSADSHHVINSFTYGPGGDLWFQEGTFQHSQIETAYGPVRCVDAGTYRYEPRTQRLEVAISYKYANPHGIAFDQWGQLFISDASGGANYWGTPMSGWLPYPEKHSTLKQWFPKRVRPTSGCEFVSSRHFPDEAQGRFLLNNCIGVQGILQHEVKEVGSGFEGKEIEPLLISSDPLFRPIAMTFAPDGSLYVIDWAEALIGHMQYSVRDPLRDKTHGRIWRVTYPSRPLVKEPKIAGESVEELLELLGTTELRTRERVKQELSTRWAEVETVLNRSPKTPSTYPTHELLEILWLHQWHSVVNEDLLKQVLTCPEPHARAAAVKVLCAWRDRLPDSLSLLAKAAQDEHPRVRLEAVRACSWFASTASTELVSTKPNVALSDIALSVLNHPMDDYLDYTLAETMRVLPVDVKSLKNPQAISYIVNRLSNDELAAAPELEPIWQARVQRRGFDSTKREAAITALMALRKQDRIAILTDALIKLDTRGATAQPDVLELGQFLLALGADLKTQRALLLTLSRNAICQSFTREIAYAAVALADGSPEEIWKATDDDVATRTMLLHAIPLIPSLPLRATFAPKVLALFENEKLHASIRLAALAILPALGLEHAIDAFHQLTMHLQQSATFDTAASALLNLPKESWDRTTAAPLAKFLLNHCQSVPTEQRTDEAFINAQMLGLAFCTLLPDEAGRPLHKQFRDLSVATFIIKTVREQMRYDTPKLTVEAGKPFQIIFKNEDIMPHNLVFVQPGTRTEIGNAAQAMAMVPDKDGYLFIPDHKGIWGKSKMIEPGQTEHLHLIAPINPGNDYEYLCTFPGHWPIMFGKLNVVPKTDE